MDRRIIEEVRNGTATHGKNGIIDTPDDVGGWPKLSSGTAPVDTDNDGMPDAWEAKYGLDANNPDDSSSDSGDGFVNSFGIFVLRDFSSGIVSCIES